MKIFKHILLTILILKGILAFPQIAKISADTTKGCDSLTVTFTDLSTIPKPDSILWEWNFGEGNIYYEQALQHKPTLTHYYKTPGIYYAYLILENVNTHAKTSSDTIKIIVSQTPSAFFQYYDTTSNDSVKILKAPTQNNNLSYEYKWVINSVDSVYGKNILWIFHAPENIVKLKVYDINPPGCKNEFSKKVIIISELDIPNVFTPNGDNLNESFYVVTNGTSIYTLTIFNRNGVLIYKTTSPRIEWDGRLQSGAIAASGTYYYSIEPTNGTKEIHGFLVLIGSDK